MRLSWSKILPEAYKAMIGMQKIADETSIEPKLMELVKIRASQINGCAHCLDMHTKDSVAIGENEQRIHVLPAWREAPFYSERERAALAWCEALTNISETGAPDEVYENLKKLFSSEEIVKLTLEIILINGWNRLAIGFRSPVGNYVSHRANVEQRN
jgi:AhpD family alkylhydroperoxidase